MNVHPVLHLHNISCTIHLRHIPHTAAARLSGPTRKREAVALAHLRVAYEPDDDDGEVASIPAPPASPPQLLPLPSAWWETPAVTSRALSPAPEEARAARVFVRDLLTCWGLDDLVDDAELI